MCVCNVLSERSSRFRSELDRIFFVNKCEIKKLIKFEIKTMRFRNIYFATKDRYFCMMGNMFAVSFVFKYHIGKISLYSFDLKYFLFFF